GHGQLPGRQVRQVGAVGGGGAARRAARAPPAAPPRVGGPAPVGAPAAGGTVSKEEMVELLTELLPEGRLTRTTGLGTDDPRGRSAPFAQGVFDDGRGAAAVSVSAGTVAEAPGCPGPEHAPGAECSRRTLADGSVLVVFKGYEYPDRREDTRLWRASLTTPEGRTVEAMEWNAPEEKGAEPTRDEPPLTEEQLEAVVTDDRWDKVLAALPEPGITPSAGEPQDAQQRLPAAEEMARHLRGLLPSRLEVLRRGAADDPGYANLVVDDGRGGTLVEIQLQEWGRDWEQGVSGLGMLYSGAEARTLEDGTRVVVRKQGSDKSGAGALQWSADSMRPDGTRVIATALNAPGYHLDANRPEPALTGEELKAIVLDDGWDRLG
ncbi:hypothetical protein ACFW9F_23410, partial [Streptomyces sp. NPDC059506]|uniref:hypothetical protein n=1 Tax=Streptomyces sp. NPDC059506 TaxID=3347751 RepID=UPI0036A387FC